MTDTELLDALEKHRVGVWPTTRERVSRPTLREAVRDLLASQGLAKRERVA